MDDDRKEAAMWRDRFITLLCFTFGYIVSHILSKLHIL